MRKYESSRNWTAGCAERCLSGAGWSWWETHCRKTEMGALLRSAFWSIPHARRSTVRPRVAAPHYRTAFAFSHPLTRTALSWSDDLLTFLPEGAIRAYHVPQG